MLGLNVCQRIVYTDDKIEVKFCGLTIYKKIIQNYKIKKYFLGICYRSTINFIAITHNLQTKLEQIYDLLNKNLD